MKTITVKMKDLLSNENNIVERTICISNIMTSCNDWNCNKLSTEEKQKEQLNSWIESRANQQHETILELISWEIN